MFHRVINNILHWATIEHWVQLLCPDTTGLCSDNIHS